MTHRVSSYVAGQWHTPSGENGLTVVDPTTGEAVALVNAEDVDIDAAITTARTQGGPALRALTFRERGALVRKFSRLIHEKRDELIGLGVQNAGNTRSDAKFDGNVGQVGIGLTFH